MLFLFRLILCFLIAGYCSGVIAADHRVGTIEQLVTALSTTASPGDTILLEEGTYQITTWALAVNTSRLTITGLTNDFDGDRRPLLGGIDLGADEFGAANTVLQNFLLLLVP